MRINTNPYDVKHWQNTLVYMRQTNSAYSRMIGRIANLYSGIPQDVPFNIENYPGLKKAIDLELRRLAQEIQQGIVNGVNNEWALSNAKNDKVVNTLLKGKTLPSNLQDKWMGRNLSSLESFIKRKDSGLGLSDRVWNITKQSAVQIERQMALGVYSGTPATELATEMKQYLNNPDALFRRVRDAEGKLQLSKAAKAYHPGQGVYDRLPGVYRSAYKNALRLTRTETNKAYQTADNERWKKQDFVVGIEVQRSNVDYDCDICDAGAGMYPKDYEWDLWHPNCRCRAVPILADEDEFIKSVEAAFDDKEYEFKGQITEFPDKMDEFIKETNFKHYGH